MHLPLAGRGGEQIGASVARRLKYRYMDGAIIMRAAAKAHVSPADIVAAERTRPLIERIVQAITTTATVDPTGVLAGHQASNPPPRSYESLITEVICEVGDEGRAVIVAHAASMALAGRSSCLRVLVTASPDTRAQRLLDTASMSQRDAKKAVEASDRERRNYLKRCYQIDEEQPTHYDLVINTDVLSSEQAADLIVTAAQG